MEYIIWMYTQGKIYSDARFLDNELAWKAFYVLSKRFDAYGLKDPKHLQRLKDNIVSDSKIEWNAYAIGASFLALFQRSGWQKRLKEI